MVVVILLYGWFFLNIKSRIETARLDLAKATFSAGQQSKFDAINHTLTELSEYTDAIDSFFIRNDDVVLFIDTIERLGTESGLIITTQDVSVTPHRTYGEEVTMSIVTSGSWQETLNFIHLLEALPYRIDIHQTKLTKQTSGSEGDTYGTGYWKTTITFSAYKHPAL